MTRKWFLGLLGIGAAGQESVTTPITPEMVKRLRSGGSLRPKPVNGECPVCGTMAPAYFPQTGKVLTVIPPINVPAEPDSRIVRCSHCNDAFWQDAEGVK